jgi:hypothetical protein
MMITVARLSLLREKEATWMVIANKSRVEKSIL